MILDLLYALILGIVEGITEWLPISSTAHLIITQKVLEPLLKKDTIFTPSFLELSDVVIQLGAILAVVIIYFKKLYPFKYNDKEYNQKEKLNIWLKVIISCIPIIIVGLLLDDIVVNLFYNLFTISITLIVYGIIFIIVENNNKNKLLAINDVNKISIKKALFLGFFQVLAIIPGTSRSGVTIIGASILGCDRKSATEYSFFLSIPIMFGASLLKFTKYLLLYSLQVREIIILIIMMIVALLVSMVVIKKLLDFIKKFSFKLFGVYRIILGIVILIVWFS